MVGGIVIGMQTQQSEPLSLAISHSPEGSTDSEAVQTLPIRSLPGMNDFPFQPGVDMDLPPSH